MREEVYVMKKFIGVIVKLMPIRFPEPIPVPAPIKPVIELVKM